MNFVLLTFNIDAQPVQWMCLGELNLLAERQVINGVRELHICKLEVVYVELAYGEALAGRKVKAASHLNETTYILAEI